MPSWAVRLTNSLYSINRLTEEVWCWNGLAKLLRRAEAAERLPSGGRLRSRRLVSHSAYDSSLPVLRHSKCGHSLSRDCPRDWFPDRDVSLVALRADTGRNCSRRRACPG